MRKLQTDEQWAAVVILPSELLIFILVAYSLSLYHCMCRQNLEVPAVCILQTSRRTMMRLSILFCCSLNTLHSIMGIDPRYLHTSLFSNLKKDYQHKENKKSIFIFKSELNDQWKHKVQNTAMVVQAVYRRIHDISTSPLESIMYRNIAPLCICKYSNNINI